MRTEAKDRADRISLIISTVLGFAVTMIVQSLLDPIIISYRHRYAVGGELVIYVAILAVTIFVSFQLLTKTLHRWARQCKDNR